MLGRFERGEIDEETWRKFRLIYGTYEQRQGGDAHMQRVKIPQGILDGGQLRALAEVVSRYSHGFGHITTRQNIQFHFVKLADAAPALRRLGESGLTTREACGNSVRNVTTCPWSGVSRDEPFDVTPYAEALTRYFLRHPLSSSLPRKFKVAFEGCTDDHALTVINDLGFRAKVRTEPSQDGQRGFAVTAGGGTATLPRFGSLLFDFLPAADLLNAAEAVVRVFHRLGDREHRNAARLKFLIRKLGWESFQSEVQKELELFRKEGGTQLPFDPERPPVEKALSGQRPSSPNVNQILKQVSENQPHGPGLLPVPELVAAPSEAQYEAWRASNVTPQKQAGYATAIATIPLGDLTAAQFSVLADLAAAYGDGTVRFTLDQDLLFRWIREVDLRPLFNRLAAAGLSAAGAGTLSDVVSCPGAETCRLAVTQSRGLGRLLQEHVRSRSDLALAAPDAKIRISGCPNGCGQHHLAAIGFQGSVRKLAGRAVPQYFVMIGGTVRENASQFARLASKIPARRVPEALDRLVALYLAERRPGENGTDFFARVEVAQVKRTLADLESLAAEEAAAADFIDLGEKTEFRPDAPESECAA